MDAAEQARVARPTSPSRSPKAIHNTKPWGLNEQTAVPAAAMFPSIKASSAASLLHADVRMDARVWAALPDDLLLEVLARVPPILLFRLHPVSRRWDSILHDLAFLATHAGVPSHGPCHLTFWRGATHSPLQCSVLILPVRARYKLSFGFLPAWDLWLVGSSVDLVCFFGYDDAGFRTIVNNPLIRPGGCSRTCITTSNDSWCLQSIRNAGRSRKSLRVMCMGTRRSPLRSMMRHLYIVVYYLRESVMKPNCMSKRLNHPWRAFTRLDYKYEDPHVQDTDR